MKKLLFLIIYSLIVLEGLKAQTIETFKTDTISQEYYLEKHGVDDTSKALIKYHFLKMRQYKIPIYIGAGMFVLSSIASYIIIENNTGFESILAAPLAAIGISGLATVGDGIQEKLELTREKLLNTLSYYRETKGVPKRFNKRYARWVQFLPKKKSFKLKKL